MGKALNIDVLSKLNRDTLSQPKVLLIEDCKCDTVLIKHILSEYYPYTLVDNAETKHDALQCLKRNQYDIILMDLNLPDTKDLTDIQEIRRHNGETPLMVVTGSHNAATTKAANQYGANGIIGKAQLIGISFLAAMEQAVNNIAHAI